jgi:TRAP-type uncharacterized transport system substrate-binding protein
MPDTPDTPGGFGRLIPKDRLVRVLGRPGHRGSLSPGAKTAILFGALGLIIALVAWLDPRPSLRHVRVAMLSGGHSGHYFATVGRFADEVSRRKGRLVNISTAGSVENVERLIAGAKNCDVHFALVQDGIAYPDTHPLELVGRMPHPESLIVVGRDADRIRTPADLRGLRVGIGPVGSGTEQLMRRVLVPLEGLDLQVSTQPIDRQLDMLERGELDLGAMVIDDGATLVTDVVKKRKLQILNIPEAASLARRLPFARVGRIEAGQIDYVRKLPAEAKDVLQVDALILSNGCASNGATQGLMTAVAEVFPTFVRHNKGQANLTGLPMAAVAKAFYDEDGPDFLGEYAPWAVDIMPLPLWIQLGVAFSVLFSAMALFHRFRLWRIDADRVKLEREIPALFGPGVTVGQIAEMAVDARQATPAANAQLDDLMVRLAALAERCRRHSLSVFVPMGEEMSYRYQETLIHDLLHALRAYRDRLPR